MIPLDSAQELAEKTRTAVLDGVVAVLSAETNGAAAVDAEPAPGEIVARGSLADVLEHFHARGWSRRPADRAADAGGGRRVPLVDRP